MDDMLGSLECSIESARLRDVRDNNEIHAIGKLAKGLSEGVDLRFASYAQFDIESSTQRERGDLGSNEACGSGDEDS